MACRKLRAIFLIPLETRLLATLWLMTFLVLKRLSSP